MKKIFSIIAVSVLAWGCHFLDENMNTHYSGEDIFGSEAALEAYVTGCYQAYASSGFYGGNNNEWFSPGSTLTHWGLTGSQLSDGQKRYISSLNLTQYSRHPNNIDVFKFKYAAIYKCNKLIAELPASPVDQTYKNEIESEGRFIRAMNYFDIVRRWGNAPLHLDPPTTIDGTSLPREKFWVIYKQILEDLTFAEKNGRDYDRQRGIAGLGSGRVCKTAATAQKALVYLTIGTLLAHDGPNDNFWVCPNEEVYAGFAEAGITSARDAFEKALACAKQVMPETAADSPYRLAATYAQLFRWTDPEDWQLRERIFVITSTNEQGASQLATWSLPGGYNNTTANVNNSRIRPSRWLFQKWCDAYGGEKGSGTTKDIYIKCGDPRMDAALIYNSYIGPNGATRTCYPASDCITVYDRTKSMPYFKKYYDPGFDGSVAGYADFYEMRLAEVYLIAAEAAANLCSTPGDAYGQEAIGYVNILLARARHKEDGTPTVEPQDWEVAAIPDKDALIEKIFWERAFEMIGEQHDWFDTHRMGATWLSQHVTIPANAFLALPEQVTKNANGSSSFRTGYYGEPTHGDENIYPVDPAEVRKGLLCAFPNDELVYNPSLSLADQNPSEIFWE